MSIETAEELERLRAVGKWSRGRTHQDVDIDAFLDRLNI
jgi:hypothetical protein